MTESSKENWTNFEIEFYKECGHLYRHFSSIRTIILTAGLGSFVTACAYILINTQDRESLILWAVAAFVFYFLILIIASIFTIKANQAKFYMKKIEHISYELREKRLKGPFESVVLIFNPLTHGYDSITGIFVLFYIFPVFAFIYRIVSMPG